MSLTEMSNVLLLFSNPMWSGRQTVPTTVIRNITAKSSQLAYEETITTNITTLTWSNADAFNGEIAGLMYVPSLETLPFCDEQQYSFIPRNVTRRSDLPPTNYNLIAIAPWFSMECTQAYMNSARLDPIRAFIFYRPNNSTNKPQDADSPVWSLDDGGAWKESNKFPIFAVSGLQGLQMTQKLSLYSGNISTIPHGKAIQELYGPNPDDYVRVWTTLTVRSHSKMPGFWPYILIVVGALLLIIAGVSLTMHFTQRRRRKSLRERVMSGEVDLEAMGIKRLTVPETHVKDFPLYTYQADPDVASMPSTPSITGVPSSNRSSTRPVRVRQRRRHEVRSVISDAMGPPSIRSKRSSLAGSVDTTATNFQPNCHICLGRFEHRVTVIRELPCSHIYHPECIDEFLTQNSSLCPMCKLCMLARGYSPKITNGMVRRERAIRRLRERVDLDDVSLESGETKTLSWSKRLLHPSTLIRHSIEVPMTAVAQPNSSRRGTARRSETAARDGASTTTDTPPSDSPPNDVGSPGAEGAPQTPEPARRPRVRTSGTRRLKLLPTQPENAEAQTKRGRLSPSSFARERMRQIAAKNAPFEDPDGSRPKWRNALSKVFPSIL